MFSGEGYSETMIEILRALYFSGKLQASVDLKRALEKRGVDVEPRTIRYHITNLEKRGLARRYGNRGVALTDGGIAEAKMLFVFDRIGGLAMETERLSLECDYSRASGRGNIMVNTLMVDEPRVPKALEILRTVSGSGAILSARMGLLNHGQRMWNYEVPEGKKALIGVSSRNYDILLQQARIPTETSATVLLHIENGVPRGIADIISHSGTTLSPGELLIRGKYTSMWSVANTGSGLATAAIKTFPSVFFDEVAQILETKEAGFLGGTIELKAQIPQSYLMTYKDRNRGYMLVYGGANFFAPLVELDIAEELSISHSIFKIERMQHVETL
ncbi:MAG: DUF128 domain-containing protein [Synergistaceae bacterium]|nr:NrpR regulatory domain-containing protein [Synergistota bacterium]NLM72098.1 DUF128 domain-containing protein [Synergistaceae bacterium]